MTAALEVRGLGYELPRTREGRRGGHLVQDVSFTVAAGETLVLLGRSGSGKTTPLNPSHPNIAYTVLHLKKKIDELQGRGLPRATADRKSTRLNSSNANTSYA